MKDDSTMVRYLGIDYGSAMVKAAACGGADEVPSLIELTPEDPFIPSAVAPHEPAGPHSAGHRAYRRHRLAASDVAFHFRDALSRDGSTVRVGTRVVAGPVVLRHLF